MIGLFSEENSSISKRELWEIVGKFLNSCLNKGFIPQWQDCLSELPSSISEEDFQSIHCRFLELTDFNFLKQILELPANEFFFHSADCIQALFPNGQKQILRTPMHREDWQMWLEILSIKFHQNWNLENPFVSFYATLFDKDCRLSMIHLSTSPQKKNQSLRFEY